jgi:2',3'-cyclic-nucleotide 2'-phosphodiesterase/3'-nucleotidase
LNSEIIIFMKNGNLKSALVISLSLVLLSSCREPLTTSVSIVETTDIHGVILPYDFIEKKDLKASLAGSSTFIRQIRSEKDAVFLLDNGDNLQGQPAVYYYNFIDTLSPHFLAEAFNWLDYDAGTVGNHDIETGHSVYDRIRVEYKFPLLAANAIEVKTGAPYFKPYVIIEKEKIRVAVLGLVTPAIPTWLPPELYSGMEFRDMVETAKLWMPEILKQNPDIVVGLFHSGWDKQDINKDDPRPFDENGSAAVAWNVPGFDIIFTGHDHRTANEKFVNNMGDTVLILNSGSRSENLAVADITISMKSGRKTQKRILGKLIKVNDYKSDEEFLKRFDKQNLTLNEYVNKVIGNSLSAASSRDAYFGSSAFIDLIHQIQMEITGADVSFAAPLSFDVTIPAGPVTVGDMFKLYRFENMLYKMELTGNEIDKYLEFSCSEWFNTMTGPSDYLLKYRLGKNGKPLLTEGKAWLRNPSYSFDSANGIDYTVDVSKPEGKQVTISSFSDGRPFEMDRKYSVALNSFRGNGGGRHLTDGVGIDSKKLPERLISSTERDLRFYMLNFIESHKNFKPAPSGNWKIIPEEWVKKASAREYKLLFGTD